MPKFNIDFFDPISLEKMDAVKLMNRIDTKYWFHIDHLQELLQSVKKDYYVLTIDGTTAMAYSTIYYDTPNKSMFIAHQNGKLNRYKVRKRTYQSTGVSFLEVKFKTNKGRTIKERMLSDVLQPSSFSFTEKKFIEDKTPFSPYVLQPALTNNFYRIMLVNKQFNERCTIDVNVAFSNDYKKQSLANLVVAEVKSDRDSRNLPLSKALHKQRIKTCGFSKYCVGMAMLDNTIKRNSFKPKIRAIEKTLRAKLF